MTNAFSNMDPEEWPEDFSVEEQAEVFEIVQEVQYLKDHRDDGPLPGTQP